MKYLLAVAVGLICQGHGTWLKAGKTADCGLCANKDLNDQAEFKRCNYWGDPHYTATWGPRNRFDYQGKGLHSVVDNADCGGFKVQAFHCQYKSSQNTVTIGLAFEWSEASGTVVRVFMNSTGVYVQLNGADVAPGTAVSYVSVPPGPVSSAQWKTGVSVQTGDECNYALVTLKTISGKPGYIMSVNLRAHDEVDAAEGICGTSDLGSTYIGDVLQSIFLPDEHGQLCALCDTFGGGGDGTPGCPGVPTTTLAPPTFSPRCAWAQTGYEESGGDGVGGFFNNIQECPIDGSSPTTQRYINNRPAAASYVFPTDFEEVCLMFYKRQGGNQATCKEVCEALGSTCNVELAGIGASGTDKCNTGLGNSNGGNCGYPGDSDVQNFNDAICACNIPPGGLNNNPAPGENLDDIPPTTQTDATNACAVGWLASVTLPDPIPVDLSDLTEEQFALWSCIIDWSLADPTDRPDIVELTQEQDPGLPITPCASSDGTLPETGTEPCRCGTASCSTGQFCDAENDVCLANCGSVPTVCSTAGTLPLPNQDQIPSLQGGCAPEQCCLPTCGDGSQPEDAACACGTAECGQGEFCDEANNVCLANCGSVPTVCSTAGTLPLPNQDQIPCLQGSCAAEQCCLPTCGDGSQPEDAACACGVNTCTSGQTCESGSCVAPSAPPSCAESQPAAGDCTCGGTMCIAGQFCESGSSTCLSSCATASTSICNGTGLLPNANTIPCNASGCTAGTCCSSPAPDVTCSTYDCTGLRWHADPAKASVTCKPSGCDHYTCCKFLRLRRRRRKGQYYNDNGDGYYAGSPELIATEESEDSAFMQHEADWCEEDDDECEDEELGAAETEL